MKSVSAVIVVVITLLLIESILVFVNHGIHDPQRATSRRRSSVVLMSGGDDNNNNNNNNNNLPAGGMNPQANHRRNSALHVMDKDNINGQDQDSHIRQKYNHHDRRRIEGNGRTYNLRRASFNSAKQLAGFQYRADLFGGSDNGPYSVGSWMENTKRLRMTLGGIDDNLINDITGGFETTFTLVEDAILTVEFKYKVNFAKKFDRGDDVEILCSLNDIRYGFDNTDYLELIKGLEGNVEKELYSDDFKNVHLDLGMQSPGDYRIAMGAYLTSKDQETERVTINFDTFQISAFVSDVVTLIDSQFDTSTDGWIFVDDPFGRKIRQPTTLSYTSGQYADTGIEEGGGALQVSLGGIDGIDVFFGMSGGWVNEFTLSESSHVSIMLSYRVEFSNRNDADEYTEVLCSVDGRLIGRDGNDYVAFTTRGIGSLPWTAVKLTVGTLAPGTYQVAVGGHQNQKTGNTEFSNVFIDTVSVLVQECPPTASPVQAPPTLAPTPAPAWETVEVTGDIKARHEACFLMVNEKGYLIGGRGVNRVDIYDPIERSWVARAGPGVEIHHMQCVAVDDSVYIVSSWTDSFPNEVNVDVVWIYNTVLNEWTTSPGLPEERRRGGAAAVLVDREIYLSHGNRGGHGDQAMTLNWLDKYNVDTGVWTTNLADAPNGRDHTGGALMADGRICVAGGRNGGVGDFFNQAVLPTDCYDPKNNVWTVEANIPQGRAGSSYGTTCDGELMVAGGEGYGIAFDDVDVFDGVEWRSISKLQQARHGSGLAVSCTCNQIHIASGSGAQGGRPQLQSLETLFPMGINQPCS